VLACTFLLQSDKEQDGPMLTTLENDNTSRRNAYLDTRKAVFGFLNKWNTTYEKKFYNGGEGYYNSNELSFCQATKKGGIYCWGCGQEGVVMLKYLNKECIKKCKDKHERKRAAGPEIGKQHLNTIIGTTNNPPFKMCDNELVYQDEYAGYDYQSLRSVTKRTVMAKIKTMSSLPESRKWGKCLFS
jgi:hypothetical protein